MAPPRGRGRRREAATQTEIQPGTIQQDGPQGGPAPGQINSTNKPVQVYRTILTFDGDETTTTEVPAYEIPPYKEEVDESTQDGISWGVPWPGAPKSEWISLAESRRRHPQYQALPNWWYSKPKL